RLGDLGRRGVVALHARLQADGVLALPRERAVLDHELRDARLPLVPEAAVEAIRPLERAALRVDAIDVERDARHLAVLLLLERLADERDVGRLDRGELRLRGARLSALGLEQAARALRHAPARVEVLHE